MSMAEIKEQVTALTPEERLEIAALIAHLNHEDDPRYSAELDARLANMDAGRKFGPADLERLHPERAAPAKRTATKPGENLNVRRRMAA